MLTKPLALASGALMTMLIALGAEAATLSPHGTVLINRGNGFERVLEPCDCRPGDMVMVNDGHAKLIYANGRASELQPGQVHACGNDGPAHAHDAGGMSGTGGMAGGAGGAGAAGIAGLSGTALAIGAVVAAVAVAGVAAMASGDGSKSD